MMIDEVVLPLGHEGRSKATIGHRTDRNTHLKDHCVIRSFEKLISYRKILKLTPKATSGFMLIF